MLSLWTATGAQSGTVRETMLPVPTQEVSVERRFEAPPDLVWGLLSDTNRSDRHLGFGAPRYTWREIDGRRQRIGSGEQSGVAVEWIEEPYEWIEGTFLDSKRIFLRGPASEGGIRVRVEPDGDGARAVITLYGELRSLALRAVSPIVKATIRRRLTTYLAGVADVLAHSEATPAPSQPAAEQAQDMLRDRTPPPLLSGAVTTTDIAELERRARQLDPRGLDAEARRRLLDALRTRPDEEVAQMRPFELARAWRLDRREVLRVFLHATQAGLVDLVWQVNCPVCKVAAGVVRTLAEVERQVHCEACNIGYDNDFAANVEAVFRCNKALRPVEPAVYCAASPSFRPHVVAQLRVAARGRRALLLPLSDARLHVRTLGPQAAMDHAHGDPPARMVVRVLPDRVDVHTEGRATTGVTKLELVSEIDDDTYVLLERGAWSADAVLGSIVASMPEFIDLFATEAPAAGLDLSVGTLTFLFSDLTGSTALYERIGDARAYAVVQQHFRHMEAAVARNGGAIVKTMGDAVMATFASPVHAVKAALEAVEVGEREHGDLGIGIKLGVHEGACLAVRANDRLDYFGTTVNIAARLQAKAGSGQLVMSAELAGQPAIRELLANVSAAPFEASLKGIVGRRSLVAFELAARGPQGAKAEASGRDERVAT